MIAVTKWKRNVFSHTQQNLTNKSLLILLSLTRDLTHFPLDLYKALDTSLIEQDSLTQCLERMMINECY